jgi:hypothetical protein
MLGSALTLASGAIVATAGSASAFRSGGDPTCTTLTGSVNLSVAGAQLVGTLNGCQSSVGDGAITTGFNLNGAPGAGSIFWPKLDRDSGITLSVANTSQTGPCPATAGGDFLMSITINVGGGPFVNTSGTSSVCVDFTNNPVLAVSNVGPITL